MLSSCARDSLQNLAKAATFGALVLISALPARAQPAPGDVPVAAPAPDANASQIPEQVPPETTPAVEPAPAGAPPAVPVEVPPVEVPPAEVPPAEVLPVAEPAAIDVTVRHQSEAERLRRSAEAVSVIETKDARRQTADLGEVLARTSGVGVQRAGGLGSDTRFSLNGLTDDQIRFFLDGVPLEMAGFPFGIANVNVNLIDRAEVFRGVVPIRFGADALGGAVNLVSEGTQAKRRAVASIMAGSFGTYRLTASAQQLHEPSGWFTRASAFLDHADNDYPMTTNVADDTGKDPLSRVYRFHDAYRAVGGNIETGVVDRKWADRLLLRVFLADYYREIQNNLLMTAVYGEPTRSELTSGATLSYEHALRNVTVSALVAYAWDQIDFKDLGTCVYDWYGRCVRPRPQPGEILGRPIDQLYWTNSGYARLYADWRVAREHSVRFSLSPSLVQRTGEDNRLANPNKPDPLAAERDLYGLVSGIDYKLDALAERLENVLFVKDYLQVLRSEEQLSTGVLRRVDRTQHRAGLGDTLRLTISSSVFAKASYEWATRMPRSDEIFGNGWPVQPNLQLKPEFSHNVNLELDASTEGTQVGTFHGNLNGFLREVDDLIVLVPQKQTALYQNVADARSLGVEAVADWTSPGRYLVLAGNTTYVDFRNTSTRGAFAKFEGERIPNRPWLFSNGSAKLTAHELVSTRDELSLLWNTRYVHSFLRGWEGPGDPTTKLNIPAQVVHSLALVYATRRGSRALSFTGEVQNLTDAEVYDFFGVPRPGRAFYFKTTGSL